MLLHLSRLHSISELISSNSILFVFRNNLKILYCLFALKRAVFSAMALQRVHRGYDGPIGCPLARWWNACRMWRTDLRPPGGMAICGSEIRCSSGSDTFCRERRFSGNHDVASSLYRWLVCSNEPPS